MDVLDIDAQDVAQIHEDADALAMSLLFIL